MCLPIQISFAFLKTFVHLSFHWWVGILNRWVANERTHNDSIYRFSFCCVRYKLYCFILLLISFSTFVWHGTSKKILRVLHMGFRIFLLYFKKMILLFIVMFCFRKTQSEFLWGLTHTQKMVPTCFTFKSLPYVFCMRYFII